MRMHKTMLVGLVIGGFFAPVAPSTAKDSCEQRLKAAETLTSYPTYLAQRLEFELSGGGTQQEVDAVKERWLEGKKQGIKDLEQIIEDCERQAKQTKNSAEAARLFAVVFNARLQWDIASPGSQQRHIYADAVATISAVDHHDQTGAVVPFLAQAAMYEWDDDNPQEGIHLMERALAITERVHGQGSVQYAEQLAGLANLLAPSENPRNPYANPARAEELLTEALAIFERYPDAMTTRSYKSIVGQAKRFYEVIGETERANALADLYSALSKTGGS